MTSKEQKAIDIIVNELKNNTGLNCDNIIFEKTERQDLNNKKFWAFKFDEDFDIQDMKYSMDSIKKAINFSVLSASNDSIEYKFNFYYNLDKTEIIRDCESNTKLMRGILFYELRVCEVSNV